MEKELRVLLLEGSTVDAELVAQALCKEIPRVTLKQVTGREAFFHELKNFAPDLVLADYMRPPLDGLAALRLVRERASSVPLIMVADALGEEIAVECMKAGAADYVIKQNLARLGPAVRGALEKQQADARRTQLEAQLRRSQKLEAIGTLASGMAHDFNNILTGIIGFAELGMAGLSSQDRLYHHLAEIQRLGDRAANLTRQLLAFASKQVMEFRRLDLNQVISELGPFLRRVLGEPIEFELIKADDRAMVYADAAQLEQVLLNLCLNARDAMPQGGKLTIEIQNVKLDLLSGQAKPGPYVLLSVRDSGTGIDPAIQDRIFEPFFSTKEPGQGTGLGLSMAYGIIQQHDGLLQVQSEVGRGTEFRIYLPALEAHHKGKQTQAAGGK